MKSEIPTFCSDCRLKRRLTWRNERTLYRRVCGFCQKSTLNVFNPDISCVVYCQNCWLGDKWEALEYGEDYNFSKTFFSQYLNLYNR